MRVLIFIPVLVFAGLAVLSPRLADARETRSKTIFGDVAVPEGTSAGEVSTVFGDVVVNGAVDGDVNSVFGEIVVENRVRGAVSSAFGDVAVRAPVRGSVETGFGDVALAAPVGGSVDAGFGNIEQRPGGVAYGGLVVRHGEVEGPGEPFTVAGDAAQQPSGRGVGDDGPEVSGGGSMFFHVVGWTLGTLGFVAGAVLVAVLIPRPLYATARSAGSSPGWSFTWGLISVPVAVVLMVLLAVSVIGLPVMLLAVPAYLGLLLFGALSVAYALGRRLLLAVGGYRGGDALAAATGALAVSAASVVPVVGGLLVSAVALTGAGAALSALFSRGWRRRSSYDSYEAYLQDRQQRGG